MFVPYEDEKDDMLLCNNCGTEFYSFDNDSQCPNCGDTDSTRFEDNYDAETEA
jgi:rubrerythrin